MNALEFEYQASLARARARERRRILVFGVIPNAVVALLGFGAACVQDVEGHTLAHSSRIALPVLLFAGVAYGRRVRRQMEERDVVVATTERERAYREPALPPVRFTQPDAWARRVAAHLVFALYAVACCALMGDSWMATFILAAVVCALAGIGVVTRRVYERWRARRNARLEVQWERFLDDSPDPREVRPREWAK